MHSSRAGHALLYCKALPYASGPLFSVGVQMEYVRCSEELRALQALKANSSSFAVALPSAESRALQSRALDDKLTNKLVQRLAKLQVDLQYDQPLAPDDSQYKQGLAAVRDQEVRKAQRDIERDVAALGSIMQERQQSGAASNLTRSQQNRAKRKRKRIRQLVDSIASWQQLDLPSSTVTQQLPASWGEQVVSNLLKGTFPWRQTLSGNVPAVLAEQFREACAEVRGRGAGCGGLWNVVNSLGGTSQPLIYDRPLASHKWRACERLLESAI